jgi:hypothetical protein
MTLSPFTLSTHNCFVHAIIVNYSDFTVNIVDIPAIFSLPDVLYQTTVGNIKQTLHTDYSSYEHICTRSLPICHSGR